MHMADALISPAVGGVMLAGSAAVAALSIKKIKLENDENRIPMIGVMGAFVFAAQMINFSIPGTGSSGHLGGGLLLAALLGPEAGFLSMACVLLIQALLFGDGGLLAYGCNLFNIGFFACFLVYPLLYKSLTKVRKTPGRILWASLASSVTALQLGAFGVVLETAASGKTDLPFGKFLILMQAIHLPIGIMEGLITSALLIFIRKAKPGLLEADAPYGGTGPNYGKGLLAVILTIALFTGLFLSKFASADPDGLEWSLSKTDGSGALRTESTARQAADNIQGKTTSILNADVARNKESGSQPVFLSGDRETSLTGLLGSAIVLSFIGMAGLASVYVRKRYRRKETT